MRITIYIPEALLKRCESDARGMNVSVSRYVRLLIEEHYGYLKLRLAPDVGRAAEAQEATDGG